MTDQAAGTDVRPLLVEHDMALRAPWVLHRMAAAAFARLSDYSDPGGDVVAERRQLEARTARTPLSRGVTALDVTVGGVPGKWLTPRDPLPGVLAYLHGGAYTHGSPRTHGAVVSLLAARLRRRTFVADYRLAPEHPHPAAVDDASAILRHLIERNGSESVTVAGDSAGGGLTMATLLRHRDEGHPLPAAAWLICPWVDLTMSCGSITSNNAHDRQLDVESLRWSAGAYGGDGRDDPSVSPLFADLHGLPPILVQVGGSDLLRDEGIELARRAAAAGVEVQLELWDRMQHVFQFLYAPFPEAISARHRGVAFLDAAMR